MDVSEFFNSVGSFLTAVASLLSGIAALLVAIRDRPHNQTRRKGESMDRRSNRRFRLIAATIGVSLILTSIWIFKARASQEDVGAYLEGVGNISPSKCTIEVPCSGLKRGGTLSIKLKSKGYASAYLQDKIRGGFIIKKAGWR